MKKYLKRILVCILMIGCVNKPVNAQMIEKVLRLFRKDCSDRIRFAFAKICGNIFAQRPVDDCGESVELRI